jgi:hypothetical protein
VKKTNSHQRDAEKLKGLIESPSFKDRSKKKETDFSRERKMSFLQLVYFMLGMIKESTQNALERFFEKIGEETFMSQQAFSEARQKIKWEAFREMFDFTVSTYYTNNPIKRWHGLRVFAVDGSKLSLPNDKSLLAYFGGLGPDKQSPTAQGSALYDVLNDLVADARIESIAVSEQALARLHIDHLQDMISFEEWRELVIFDRGYASIELIRALLARKIHYVMRVRSKFSTAIDSLGCGSHVIELGRGEGRVPVRVIKFRLSSGEIETLITDLVDTKYGTKTFKALYFKRWPIETKYDRLKNKLEIENFSARLVDNIRQDFFATMVMTNLATDFLWEA